MGTKVLIVTTVSGFLYQFEQNSVELWKERGAKLHYASNFARKAYEFDDDFFEKNEIMCHPLPIEKSPWKLGKNFRALKALVEIVRREEIDILHCHNPVGGVLGRLAARLSGRKMHVIYTAHGFHFYKGAPMINWLLYYPAEYLMARYTDTLITINGEDRMAAGRFRLKAGGRVFQIPGVGVDTERFSPQPGQREAARKILGVKEGELCLLTAALLDKDKNHSIILQLLEEWKREEDFPPLKYVICGEGTYREALEREVRERGLEELVSFAGFRQDLAFLLQGADLFLFPSLREGLGMAALEAMACGLPVAAADNRGVREYVRHGNNGFLCDGRSVGDFKMAIKAAEKMHAKGMKSAALETACRYAKEQSKRQMEMIFRSALCRYNCPCPAGQQERRKKWIQRRSV